MEDNQLYKPEYLTNLIKNNVSSDIQISREFNLKMNLSLNVDCLTPLFLEPGTSADFLMLAKLFKKEGISFYVLGGGTNIFPQSDRISYPVITTSELDFINLNENCVEVGAGTQLQKFIMFAISNGFTGLTQLAGIPGSVGGAIIMNTGAFGCNISDKLKKVTVIDLNDAQINEVLATQISFGYRSSSLKPNYIILSAVFEFAKTSNLEDLFTQYSEVLKKKKDAQPIDKKSCGCVFKNPQGKSAWELINESGLQGIKKGGAQVSEKHSNFIINTTGASLTDLNYLREKIKIQVKEKLDYELEEEVILWN